jgi:hypothetical protein
MGAGGRLQQPGVCERCLHRNMFARSDAMLGGWRGDVRGQRAVGEPGGMQPNVHARCVLGRVHDRFDTVLGQRRADLRFERAVERTCALHRPSVRDGCLHRNVRP